MDKGILIELIGYLGSLLVVVSMLMTSVMRLRIINTIGSIIFMVYALIIHSYPTAVMNLFLIGINIYQMIRLRNTAGNEYSCTEVNAEDRYLGFLLDFYKDDIKIYFPDFEEQRSTADTWYIVSLNGEPVGITGGKRKGKVLHLVIDYSTPAYRDCSVGEYLYAKLKELGYSALEYEGDAPGHIEYLLKVGFVPEQGVHRKVL